MAVILGIDLGTSSIKAMLLDSTYGVIDTAACGHDVEIPKEGFAEQDPQTWWNGLLESLSTLQRQYPEEYGQISAIGFSGQMHGLVMVDSHGNCVRPAVLWLDQRSKKQVEQIYECFPEATLQETLRNRVFTGFAFPSLLWIREQDPESFDSIAHIMMPKDYIRFRMTGKIATDVTDASATAAFEIAKHDWAWEIIDGLNLPRNIFPACHESTEIAGYITRECSSQLGLKEGIPVVYGCGDQQAQSIGNGVYEPGKVISNIGTGGQIAALIREPLYDKQLRTHTFCHAVNQSYTIYGAALTSGMSQKWLKNNVLNGYEYTELNRLAEQAEPGSAGLTFLPYLSGERTPHMNPDAKGVFFGLTLNMDQRYLSRSVLEGVTYSLKDSLMIFEELGIHADTIIASGGGAKSPLWLQMQADIFEKKVKVCTVSEQACMGACIVAGMGCRIFTDWKQAAERLIRFEQIEYLPDTSTSAVYRKGYQRFKDLYQATKGFMRV